MFNCEKNNQKEKNKPTKQKQLPQIYQQQNKKNKNSDLL